MATRVIPKTQPPTAPILEGEPVSNASRVRLGRYELLFPIATGGMAQVWAAEQLGDLGFRRVVALKTIRPEFAEAPDFRAMFLDEAQLASRIRHANVVEVLDLGVEGSSIFQAMSLIEGVPLSRFMRDHHVSIETGLTIVVDMLRGLHAAHELCDDDGTKLGLVHRDVSPQNVLVGTDGVAKLADFGIAKAFGRITEETVFGDIKGKTAYLAPEQLAGLPAAPQSDIFSAGVVFWEILTHQRLFKVAGQNTTVVRHNQPVRDPREASARVPEALAAIAMRALKDLPFDRFETAEQMADEIEAAAKSLGVNLGHRRVATELEARLGGDIRQQRERLREARRGGKTTTAPVIAPPINQTQEIPTAVAIETLVAPIPPPAPAVRRSQLPMTIAVLMFAAMLAIVVVMMRKPPAVPEPAPVFPAAAPIPSPMPAPTPTPTVSIVITDPIPTAPVAPSTTTTTSTTRGKSPPSPPHHPVAPAKHSPPPPKPAPAPVPAPASSAKPAFENPY